MSSYPFRESASPSKPLGVLLFSFASHALVAGAVLAFVAIHKGPPVRDRERVAVLNIAKPYRLPADQLSPDVEHDKGTESASEPPQGDFRPVEDVRFSDPMPTSTGDTPSGVPSDIPSSIPSAVGAPGGTSGEGSAPVGRLAQAFPEAASARSVVFVLDRSSSMGLNGTLAVARDLLGATLDELPAGITFQVLAYNQHAVPLRVGVSAGLLPVEPGVIAEAKRHVQAITATGKTDHREGILRALLLRPECIHVITDELKLTWEEVREITRQNSHRTSIHVLELKGRAGHTDPLVELLVRNNKGSARKLKEDD